MNTQLVFRNPEVRFRKESFGGMVKIDSQALLLNVRSFDILVAFSTPKYLEDALSEIGKELLEEFIGRRILLTISAEVAQDILAEKGGGG